MFNRNKCQDVYVLHDLDSLKGKKLTTAALLMGLNDMGADNPRTPAKII